MNLRGCYRGVTGTDCYLMQVGNYIASRPNGSGTEAVLFRRLRVPCRLVWMSGPGLGVQFLSAPFA